MGTEFEDRFFHGQPAGTYDRIIWTGVLSQLLGWPKERIAAEISELSRLVEETGPFHYHEAALWYVSHLLVPEDLRGRLAAPDLNRVAHQLHGIVFPEGEPSGSLEEAESFDWASAKRHLDLFFLNLRRGRDT